MNKQSGRIVIGYDGIRDRRYRLGLGCEAGTATRVTADSAARDRLLPPTDGRGVRTRIPTATPRY